MRVKQIIITLLILSVLLSVGYFILNTDYHQVMDYLRHMGWRFMIILLLSGSAFTAGAVAWMFAFRREHAPAFLQLWYARTVSEQVGIFNPTNIIAGEAYKFEIIHEHVKDRFSIWSSIFISRAILIATHITLCIIAIIYYCTQHGSFIHLIYIITVVAAISLVAYFIARKTKILDWRIIIKKKYTLLRIISTVIRYAQEHKQRVIAICFFSVLHWLLGAAEVFYILNIFGSYQPFMDALTLDMMIVLLKSAGGFMPGQLGIEELGNKWMLALIGVQSASIWLAVCVIRRSKQIFWIAFTSLLFLIYRITISNKKRGRIIYNT